MGNMPYDHKDMIKPILVRRACGGWLAMAPKQAFFQIAVTGPTEESARQNFGSAYNRWGEILTLDVPK